MGASLPKCLILSSDDFLKRWLEIYSLFDARKASYSRILRIRGPLCRGGTWENWMGSEWLRMGHSILFISYLFPIQILFISYSFPIQILFISYSFPILSHSILFSFILCQNLVHSIPIFEPNLLLKRRIFNIIYTIVD